MKTCLVAVVVSALAIPASAQGQAQRTAASLVLTEGGTSVNETSVDVGAVPSVLPGIAVVRTTQGRAAIALKRGGWLFLNAGSSARIHGNGVYNFNRIEILTGSAIVVSATSAPLVVCESEIRLSTAGLFRFDAQPVNAGGERPCRFRVFEGAAAVPLTSVINALRPGQSMICNARCGDMIPTTEFSVSELDEFDRWARQLQQQLRG